MNTPITPLATEVIAIDGPGGSGKDTTSEIISGILGLPILDSGSIYRLIAFHCLENGINTRNSQMVSMFTNQIISSFGFKHGKLCYNHILVGDEIRTQRISTGASEVSKVPAVREHALQLQRYQATIDKGLIANGRDMGSVVFPDACVKIFLTATPEVRAQRRLGQALAKGEKITLAEVLEKLQVRDHEDSTRSIAPLICAQGALTISTDRMSPQKVADVIIRLWHNRSTAVAA